MNSGNFGELRLTVNAMPGDVAKEILMFLATGEYLDVISSAINRTTKGKYAPAEEDVLAWDAEVARLFGDVDNS